MATSVAMRAFCWGDGETVASQDMRLEQIGALLSGLGGPAASPLSVGQGVRDGTGFPLKVAVSSGLSVTVATGFGIVQGSTAANSGAYSTTLDSVATLTCATADPVNPRIDSVCITVTDLGTSGSGAVVQIVTGTAASAPVAPTLPANSLLLCTIAVAANATSLVAANLTDQRVFIASAGGIKPVMSASLYPTTGPASAYAHSTSTSRLLWFNGTQLQAPQVAAWAPRSNGPNTVTASGTAQTVSSSSVAVDGLTNVKISFTYDLISNAGTSAGNACTLAFMRGASNLKSITKTCWGADSNIDGGTITFTDFAPAAGTYTYGVTIVNQGAGTYQVHNGIIYLEAIST